MRIRYLTQYYQPEPCAPAARVSGLSREWVRAGHQVEVVTGFPNHPTGVVPREWRGKITATEEDHGVRVLRNWFLPLANRGMPRRLTTQAAYALSASTLGLARSGPADVVIATSPSIFTGFAGMVHHHASRIPYVYEVRDLWPQLFIEMGMIRNRALIASLDRVVMALYRGADRIVTVTDRFAKIIAGKGIPAEKIRVIHNGVDADAFAPVEGERQAVREALGYTDEFVISYVGTHGVLHRLDYLIDLAEALKDDDRFKILFVGEGAERLQLEAAARSRGLRNVTFAGLQPPNRVRGYYAASDLGYVPLRPHPFLQENFVPSKIFELLAVGRPILGAVGGEAAEILERSGVARVVVPGDIQAMRAAVLDIAARPPAAEALAAARAFARQFDRTTLGKRYLGYLEELVAAGAAG